MYVYIIAIQLYKILADMKNVTLNYNSTIEDIEKLEVGDRLTIEESGKVGGVFSVSKEPKGSKFLYEIVIHKDNGLLSNVFLLRPTSDQ